MMENETFFRIPDGALDYLRLKDKKLAVIIDRIGEIRRAVIPDLYSALIHSIVGQQIATKAHESIWRRICEAVPDMSPHAISTMPDERLQSLGLSWRKVSYIKKATEKIVTGEFDIAALHDADDEEVIRQLTSLDGVGVWTAEMLMLFSMQRPDILSFGDLAILRGMRMVYRHRDIDRSLFEKYRRRLSPHASTASLYFWAVAGGTLPEITDPQPKRRKQ